MMQKIKLALIAIMLWSNASIATASQELDFIVLGVIASNDNQNGVALLKHKKTGKVKAFREGESIDQKFIVKAVHRKSVAFSDRDKLYTLQVGDDVAQETPNNSQPQLATNISVTDLRGKVGIERSGSVLTVSNNLKESLVGENLNKILMQAAAVPYTVNGRLVGFKLTEIDQGSIYDVAGFKDGDVITHIDEKPINNVAYALRALRDLKNATSARFSYLRHSEEHELTIRIN